ncbi:hypothetical protein Taro_013683 [Colocasia esculenta]|uniref:BURP domain-containing protein n=1 Tax=Colocasia esculenta TaxID=4460 RepID=A0A843UCI0_COLES|nr:hypothetical protein [Colocasia esculenta]
MGRRLTSPFLLFVLFVAIASAVTYTLPQDHWKKALPGTSMPSAVRDLLPTGKETSPGGAAMEDNKGIVIVPGYWHPYWHPYWYYWYPYPGTYIYKYAASESQLHDDPNASLFFLEKDLHPGAKMMLHFTRTAPAAAFVPRAVADSIPFSSKKLPEILTRFSLKPNSMEEAAMRKTLRECEETAAEGETSGCATSLESMIDFATSSLGTHDVRAVSTEVGKGGAEKQQYYTVVSAAGQSLAVGGKSVTCHAQSYPYAVFYCHATPAATKAYVVPLAGEDGSQVTAVAVCHADTSAWNPRHLAFQVLKVKPGAVSVCHFLTQDHIVWAPRK